MVRTVHLFEAMSRACIVPQRLNVVLFLFRKIMTGNVELQRTAKCDIQHLYASTNAKNRQTARERLGNRIELPAVPLRIDIVMD
jgi:hypothetical protein